MSDCSCTPNVQTCVDPANSTVSASKTRLKLVWLVQLLKLAIIKLTITSLCEFILFWWCHLWPPNFHLLYCKGSVQWKGSVPVRRVHLQSQQPLLWRFMWGVFDGLRGLPAPDLRRRQRQHPLRLVCHRSPRTTKHSRREREHLHGGRIRKGSEERNSSGRFQSHDGRLWRREVEGGRYSVASRIHGGVQRECQRDLSSVLHRERDTGDGIWDSE